MSRQYVIETLSAAALAVLDTLPVDVFTENGPGPDFANQIRTFVVMEIAMDKRDPVGLGASPKRISGAIQFGVFEKSGEGTGVTTQVMDALDAAMANRYIGSVLMNGWRTFRTPSFSQWNPAGVQYLFTFDDID